MAPCKDCQRVEVTGKWKDASGVERPYVRCRDCQKRAKAASRQCEMPGCLKRVTGDYKMCYDCSVIVRSAMSNCTAPGCVNKVKDGYTYCFTCVRASKMGGGGQEHCSKCGRFVHTKWEGIPCLPCARKLASDATTTAYLGAERDAKAVAETAQQKQAAEAACKDLFTEEDWRRIEEEYKFNDWAIPEAERRQKVPEAERTWADTMTPWESRELDDEAEASWEHMKAKD